MSDSSLLTTNLRRPKPRFKLGVVILAAGRSRRMGRPKLLLPWRGTTVLGHLLREWRSLRPAQMTVVYGTDPANLLRELDLLAFPRLARIENPHPDRGMFSSIQCAAAWPGWNQGLTHWAVVLGDQPHLRRETLRAVCDCAAAHPDRVCQPAFNARAGHPVLLPRRIFRRLPGSIAQNLRAFLGGIRPKPLLCPVEDSGLGSDLDTPDDYARLAAKTAGPPSRHGATHRPRRGSKRKRGREAAAPGVGPGT